MSKNRRLIENLEKIVFGLKSQILTRAIQYKIFKNKGLLKIGRKI